MIVTLKATGIVRKIDDLGRIVLPIQIRKERGIEPKDGVEMFVDGDNIVLQKYVPGCVFCGERDGLTLFKGKLVCDVCRDSIKPAAVRLHL